MSADEFSDNRFDTGVAHEPWDAPRTPAERLAAVLRGFPFSDVPQELWDPEWLAYALLDNGAVVPAERLAEAWDEGHRFTGYEPVRGENPYRTEGR